MKTFGINVPDAVVYDLVYTGTHVLTGTGQVEHADYLSSVFKPVPPELGNYNVLFLSADYYAVNRETYHGYVGTDFIAGRKARKIGIIGKYNFHQAFYPAGYYSPPFGETPTIEVIDSSLLPANTNQGPCPYNFREDLQLFGIPTTQNKVNSFTINMGLQPLHEPSEECPPDIPQLSFYTSVSLLNSAGTLKHMLNGTVGGIGGNFYNDNPIPASIDTKSILHKQNSLWDLIPIQVGSAIQHHYKITQQGEAIPSVVSRPNHDKLDNILCKARALETNTIPGIGFVGLQLGAADGFAAAANDQYNFGGYDAWNMWHFYFKYNHWNYPFEGSHEGAPKLVAMGPLALAAKEFAAEEHWWENRQCADTNDFLPWTTNTTIHACPSEYFDIPYYAAIKRFGFFGTRFQNTCKKTPFVEVGPNGELIADHPVQTGYKSTFPIGGVYDEDTPISSPDGEACRGFGLSAAPEYDGLLTIANQEEKFANFYAANKAFFLWANYSGIKRDPALAPLFLNDVFSGDFERLKSDFDRIFWNIHNFINGGYNAFVMVSSLAQNNKQQVLSTRFSSETDHAISSDYWIEFDRKSKEELFANASLYDTLISKYSKYVYDFRNGGADHVWYDNFIKEKEKRIRTRYFENKINGLPIDLFPANSIRFSSEEAWKNLGFDDQFGNLTDLPINSGWLRSNYGDLSIRDILPKTDRRYFYGGYVNSGEISLWKSETRPSSTASKPFYAGFLNNIKCGSDEPAKAQENNARITGVKTYPQIRRGSVDANLLHSDGEVFAFGPLNMGIVPTSGYLISLGYSPEGFREGGSGIFFSGSKAVVPNEVGEETKKLTSQGFFDLLWDNESNKIYFGGFRAYDINFVGPGLVPEKGYTIPPFKGIGKVTPNFSCFSPIFIQNPIDVLCKIGQAPTFRVDAVDYHSIPEDKMKSARYSEINYWTQKLKLVDRNNENLYPLNYSWYRTLKDNSHSLQRTKAFDVRLNPLTGYAITINSKVNGLVTFNVFDVAGWKSQNPKEDITSYTPLYANILAEKADPYGSWSCLEGENSKQCTLCHPKESVVIREVGGVAAIHSGIPTGLLDTSLFVKGAKKGHDDNYQYFCVVSGRFGHRTSEIATLDIEDFATFDVSVMIGLNASTSDLKTVMAGSVPRVATAGQPNPNGLLIDYTPHQVEFGKNDQSQNILNYPYRRFDNQTTAPTISPFFGFIRDTEIINEQVIEENINMSNNCISYSFVGPEGWRGHLRSYTPSVQAAVNGVAAKRSHWRDYGPLITLSKPVLTQLDGDLLYGAKTLPSCLNFQANATTNGVKSETFLGGLKVKHKTVGQRAFATNNPKVGLVYKQLEGISQLYPPGYAGIRTGGGTGAAGTWQFHNNIGAIKRFGVGSTTNSSRRYDDIELDTSLLWESKDKMAQKIFNGLFKKNSSLGGDCGFHEYAIGANLLYFVENLQRFYIYCPPKGKKVRNFNYTAPGLRFGVAAVQYNWLGRPSNVYLERRPKAGPYAYEWKVIRHNRDRRGNGWSEGFWSSFWSKQMYLYDQPAVYGLYKQSKSQNASYKTKVRWVKNRRYKAQGQILTNAAMVLQLQTQYVNFILKIPPQPQTLNFVRIGPRIGPKTSCGSMQVNCGAVGAAGDDPLNPSPICDWLDVALMLGAPPGSSYGCSRSDLDAGKCFDPCLSLKYTQGFYPGGKLLSLTANFIDGTEIKTTQLVNEANYEDLPISKIKGTIGIPGVMNKLVTSDGGKTGVQYVNLRPGDKNAGAYRVRALRGPMKTISPCKDGGADHCNYLTPVINIGESCGLEGSTNATASLRDMFGGLTILDYDAQGNAITPKNVI